MRTLHLKGLNGIRAIAAMGVVISHTLQALTQFHLQTSASAEGLDIGGFGVSMFFALSGFLITYLLLLEKARRGIDVPKFYLRRILRIWPLYYLYLLVAVAVAISYSLPFDKGTLAFIIFFAANIAFILGKSMPFLAHFWSLGVEEQFYLFWPWLARKKHLLQISLAIACVLIALKLFFRWHYGDASLPYVAVHVTRFQCMLLGAAAGILYKDKKLGFLTHPVFQGVAWLVIALAAVNRFHIASVLDNEFVSVVTAVLIIGQVEGKGLINLENRVLDFIGKISYGIYVIHPLVIFGLSKWLTNLSPGVFSYVLVFGGVAGITIGLAFLSYNYYEKWFLKLKSKYAVVKTSSSKDQSYSVS